MKTIKTFEQFTGSLKEDAIDAGPDSKVIIDDVSLDSGKEIKSTEILGAILSSKTEKEYKEYFYNTFGNGAFTEEDISTLVKFFNEYREEAAEIEKEADAEEDGAEEEDPLAGI
jgi:hypothetical protein